MSFNDLSTKDELKVKILYYRKKSGMTQSEVAEKMGMTRSSYAYAETRAEKLTPDFLNRLAKIFGISPNVFISETPPKRPTFGNTPSDPPDVFVTTNKEQRVIKMLRMLPIQTYNDIYELIRKNYEESMSSDD